MGLSSADFYCGLGVYRLRSSNLLLIFRRVVSIEVNFETTKMQ